ncbi:DUF742 domain-containing protein [Streptomyces nanhaiensis]|uniref:DUF742 domain-containing protein n=1 Tax=Streptomyces nanhaiensis TaxID=679319 RepID=UPI00399CCBC6
MTRPRRDRSAGLVRPYVVTGGRFAPSRNHFDHITLVVRGVRGLSRAELGSEQCRVLDLLESGALSVAEIGHHLGLPISVLRVLLSELMEHGHITTRSTILTPSGPHADGPDRELLEAVLAGLRAQL